MIEINIAYEGELHCSAKHGPSGTELSTDAPVDNQGRGESFSPTDLVATALGSCMVTIMGIYAKNRELAIEGTRVRVTKEMTPAPPRRIARLGVRFEVPLPADHPDCKGLMAAADTCPVKLSLLGDIEIDVEWVWLG